MRVSISRSKFNHRFLRLSSFRLLPRGRNTYRYLNSLEHSGLRNVRSFWERNTLVRYFSKRYEKLKQLHTNCAMRLLMLHLVIKCLINRVFRFSYFVSFHVFGNCAPKNYLMKEIFFKRDFFFALYYEKLY